MPPTPSQLPKRTSMTPRRIDRIARLAWLFALAAGTAAGGSCIGPDPNHCRHNAGDEACGGDTPFCNMCLSSDDNKGCVAEPPEERCYFAGENPASDGTGTTGSTPTSSTTEAPSESSGTTGPPPGCTAEGEADPECPEETPYCVDGRCSNCTEGGDALCEAADASTPICGALGLCVECSADDASVCSAPTEFCDANGACSGCFEHSQCGMAGCDLYRGECLSEELIEWVEGPECMPETGFGSEAQPYCNLGSVQENIDGLQDAETKVTVRIISGTFSDSLSVSGEGAVVAVLADGEEQPTFGGARALVSSSSGTIYAQGVRVEGDGQATVRCNSNGKAWLRDVEVRNNPGAVGIESLGNCEFTLERGVVTGNSGGGVRVQNSSFAASSSVIANNGEDAQETHGITAEDSTVELRHVTVIENDGSIDGRNLDCTAGTEGLVRNSIVMREMAQSVVGCDGVAFQLSATDEPGLVSEDEGVVLVPYQPGFFLDGDGSNVRLTSDEPFGMLGRWSLGDPRVDLAGDAFNVGVDEVNAAGCFRR
ncbi:MAG: right-handed parallel beta-helix repeat-containing protein [Myxococcota bacterium]